LPEVGEWAKEGGDFVHVDGSDVGAHHPGVHGVGGHSLVLKNIKIRIPESNPVKFDLVNIVINCSI
jgi:hypothetical protein